MPYGELAVLPGQVGRAGRLTAHHALIVGQILARVDFLDESIGRLSDEIDRVVLPFARQRDCSTRSPA